MTPGEAAREALERLYRDEAQAGFTPTDWTAPGAIRALALSVNGGAARGTNQALAGALGVTKRTVERWVTEKGTQRRQPNPRLAAALRELGAPIDRQRRAEAIAAAPRRVLRAMRARGVVVHFVAMVGPYLGKFSGGSDDAARERQKTITVKPDGEGLGPFIAAAANADDDVLGAAFSNMVFAAWRGPSVDSGFGAGEWGMDDVSVDLTIPAG